MRRNALAAVLPYMPRYDAQGPVFGAAETVRVGSRFWSGRMVSGGDTEDGSRASGTVNHFDKVAALWCFCHSRLVLVRTARLQQRAWVDAVARGGLGRRSLPRKLRLLTPTSSALDTSQVRNHNCDACVGFGAATGVALWRAGGTARRNARLRPVRRPRW